LFASFFHLLQKFIEHGRPLKISGPRVLDNR